MTPPDLTPEQMNAAEEAMLNAGTSFDTPREQVHKALTAALAVLLPDLHAAWQEQTAAKAGENPVPDEAGAHAQQAWDEGVVAGAAAATAAERERTGELEAALHAARAFVNWHAEGPCGCDGEPDDQCDSCRALAVLDLIEKGDTMPDPEPCGQCAACPTCITAIAAVVDELERAGRNKAAEALSDRYRGELEDHHARGGDDDAA